MKDLAEIIHKAVYKKTGRANSPSNQNDDFQAGYIIGMNCKEAMDEIHDEWVRRGSPEPPYDDSFKEWKRGLWAAKFQKTLAGGVQEGGKA